MADSKNTEPAGIPDFEGFSLAMNKATNLHGLALENAFQLENRHKQAVHEAARYGKAKTAILDNWHADLALADPIYSMSYYATSETENKQPVMLRDLHERGRLLHQLARSLEAQPQPVLAINTKKVEVGNSRSLKTMTGYSALKATTFDQDPMRVVSKIDVDSYTGIKTITPIHLDLTVVDVTYIDTETGGYDDDVWLENSRISTKESSDLVLLANYKRGGVANRTHLSAKIDDRVEKVPVTARLNIFIGAAAIDNYLKLQEAELTDNHDKATFYAIAEHQSD